MSFSNKAYFIEIIQEHQGIINSICKIYYHDTEDIKDARQDIILQLWKSLPTFRNESKISTWIYKVALNTILAKIEKERKKSVNETISDAHLDYNFKAGHDLDDDDVEQLLFFINRLEATDKAIMILNLEGYSNKEVAETLKLTPTNISTRINRIKTKLKEAFKTICHGTR